MKQIGKAFLVGGVLSLIGQAFFVILKALFGAGSPIVGPGTLMLMGILALIMFPTGLYQRLISFGGFGAILPFSGLAAAVAEAFCAKRGTRGGTRSAISGIKAGSMVVVFVIGSGTIVAALAAVVMAFVL